jgi:L-fuconolactonase
MTRVDAHQHFWRIERGDYRWLGPGLAPLYRDFLPADLAPLLREAGIARSVLVQAADTVAESEFLLALAREHDFVAGVVGWVDLEGPGAAGEIDRLSDLGPLVGVRPMLQDLPDDAWIARRELEPALRALARRRLAFDALVKPRHLPHLETLVERHPELEVVIDHGAKPDVASGRAWSGFDDWKRSLARLARGGRVHVKLSGLATEAAAGWSADDLRPFAEALLELFGPRRVLWGSDWPVVELGGGWRRWLAATQELLRTLSPEERENVLGGNAARFYRLGSGGP